LGAILVSRLGGRRTAGRIVETEAYLGYADPASHGYRQRRHAHGLIEQKTGHIDGARSIPIDELERAYSLEEVRDNYELRARMRRVDLDAINFEFGAFDVTPDQYPKLERVARAMLGVLRRDPDAVFMVEGHTDAVGSDEDNLSLSDRRASSVAEILTETFGVPPENLVTQGYGEQYLKVDTQRPEPLNRRVTILNITRLLAER